MPRRSRRSTCACWPAARPPAARCRHDGRPGLAGGPGRRRPRRPPPAPPPARSGAGLAGARRRRSFRPAAAPPPGFRTAVLNLAAAAPAPRLGGVQAQLLWRLAAEAAERPVALLYPEPAAAGGGYRLELQD